MTDITLDGIPVHTHGSLPAVGAKAPGFALVGNDLSPVALADFAGSRLILNVFPSVDTGICATSVRTFNERAARDLPFAQARFCGAEGIENVTVASDFRTTFGEDYGVTMVTGPLEGLLARAVIVLDEKGTVIHSQLVPEIKQEPDYEAAIAAL